MGWVAESVSVTGQEVPGPGMVRVAKKSTLASLFRVVFRGEWHSLAQENFGGYNFGFLTKCIAVQE